MGDYILPDGTKEIVLKILQVFEITDIPVLRFQLESMENQELTAMTEGGVKIYFSLRFDPAFTVESLQSLKDQLPILEHIDFRSENKVFYK